MKTLIVEDDFISRKVMQKLLSVHGETEIAVNGKEAIEAFKSAREAGAPYDLICLDIMMPELNGLEVLQKIRDLESTDGVGGLSGVKIIMTTGLGDKQSILAAFRTGCEAYLMKPVDPRKVNDKLLELGLIRQSL